VMLGRKLKDLLKTLERGDKTLPYFGVKEAVFPFGMFPGVDPVLGPEMKSTGEVMGIAPSFGLAFYKAQEAASMHVPTEGTVLISATDPDKPEILEVAARLAKLGFTIRATKGTKAFLAEHDVNAELAVKLHEGRPDITDEIRNGRIHLVINTPAGGKGKHDDSYIRQAAIQYKVPYITTTAAARATVAGIETVKRGQAEVKAIQDYHKQAGFTN
jgi:carbamoyl-phosphate synthase large subunit